MGVLSVLLMLLQFVAQMGTHTAAGVSCVLRMSEYSMEQT